MTIATESIHDTHKDLSVGLPSGARCIDETSNAISSEHFPVFSQYASRNNIIASKDCSGDNAINSLIIFTNHRKENLNMRFA